MAKSKSKLKQISFSDATFLSIYLQSPKESRKFIHKKYKALLSKEAKKLLLQIDRHL